MTTVVTDSSASEPVVSMSELLRIGSRTLRSRLIVGSGKYDDLELMRQSIEASGADCVTVAVRRERLYNREGKYILDYLDPAKYTLLPNTA
ncbi:MAG: thiazole synthase, partial [Planctomycetales bacterium]|nr:thiazole synthase [Planctomycetales bacterium]